VSVAPVVTLFPPAMDHMGWRGWLSCRNDRWIDRRNANGIQGGKAVGAWHYACLERHLVRSVIRLAHRSSAQIKCVVAKSLVFLAPRTRKAGRGGLRSMTACLSSERQAAKLLEDECIG
jgi:hypothetical protein